MTRNAFFDVQIETFRSYPFVSNTIEIFKQLFEDKYFKSNNKSTPNIFTNYYCSLMKTFVMPFEDYSNSFPDEPFGKIHIFPLDRVSTNVNC